MMTVFIDQATARLALVLNPIARFFLERAAKLARPNHSGRPDFAGSDEIFDALKVGRVAQFVTEHQDAIGFLGQLKHVPAFFRSDAAGLFEKQMLSRAKNLLG